MIGDGESESFYASTLEVERGVNMVILWSLGEISGKQLHDDYGGESVGEARLMLQAAPAKPQSEVIVRFDFELDMDALKDLLRRAENGELKERPLQIGELPDSGTYTSSYKTTGGEIKKRLRLINSWTIEKTKAREVLGLF